MVEFRLIKLVESRIQGDLYVRFGGEYLETYHRNVARRRMLSLHNQCVMFAERRAFTYGRNKVSVEELFNVMDGWLGNFQNQMSADRARIEFLKNTRLSHEQVITFIGVLASIRVAHDSKDKSLRDVVETYPLNNTQVNAVTEDLLKMMRGKPYLTGWEVYNVMTLRYKPEEAEIPTLIPQNFAAVETLVDFIEGKKTVIDVEAEEVN